MKQIRDMSIVSNERIGDNYLHITVTPQDGQVLPEILPGQFVNILIPSSKNTFLRRPISVNDVDYSENLLHLLVRKAGEGTRSLEQMSAGMTLNMVLPLGNTFPVDDITDKRILLIGGGVGVAPLLYYGRYLKSHGAHPTFVLGARSEKDLLELEKFSEISGVHVATEDGSRGTKGFVTNCEILQERDFDKWICCGPLPMMKAVAAMAEKQNVSCYVSLENVMACGLGACLCCVEKTKKGNVCVCTEGPVFDIKDLKW